MFGTRGSDSVQERRVWIRFRANVQRCFVEYQKRKMWNTTYIHRIHKITKTSPKKEHLLAMGSEAPPTRASVLAWAWIHLIEAPRATCCWRGGIWGCFPGARVHTTTAATAASFVSSFFQKSLEKKCDEREEGNLYKENGERRAGSTHAVVE